MQCRLRAPKKSVLSLVLVPTFALLNLANVALATNKTMRNSPHYNFATAAAVAYDRTKPTRYNLSFAP